MTANYVIVRAGAENPLARPAPFGLSRIDRLATLLRTIHPFALGPAPTLTPVF